MKGTDGGGSVGRGRVEGERVSSAKVVEGTKGAMEVRKACTEVC